MPVQKYILLEPLPLQLPLLLVTNMYNQKQKAASERASDYEGMGGEWWLPFGDGSLVRSFVRSCATKRCNGIRERDPEVKQCVPRCEYQEHFIIMLYHTCYTCATLRNRGILYLLYCIHTTVWITKQRELSIYFIQDAMNTK
jgi:hypothetical protein